MFLAGVECWFYFDFLKQVALMMVIYVFLDGGEGQVGLSDLIKATGLTRGGIFETIDPLVRRGLLVERWGRIPWVVARRGISRLLHPSKRLSKRCRA